MIATCTKCNNQFDGNDGPEHTNHVTAFGHPPEQHYHVVADLSGEGNEAVKIEIPEPIANMIRAGVLTLAIVPDPSQPRGLGLQEIILNPPPLRDVEGTITFNSPPPFNPLPPAEAAPHGQAETFYLLRCLQCQTNPDAKMVFASEAERGGWAAEHTKGTGHNQWHTEDVTPR